MLLQFEDRENTRVRDLADLVILHEQGLIEPRRTAEAVRSVFTERTTPLPIALPPLPTAWPERYEKIAREHDIAAASFAEAISILGHLWNEMFPRTRQGS
jgi:hypothetical protein